jgi:3-hydroxyacyl-CoA dehydrogenase
MIRFWAVGGGVIGRSWAIVAARAGFETHIVDVDRAAVDHARSGLEDAVRTLGLPQGDSAALRSRIQYHEGLDDALKHADYVQESIAEDAVQKRSLLEELAARTSDKCIVASSCSSLLPEEFCEDLRDAERIIVAHPFNPPHLVPLVELVPSARTSPQTVEQARRILTSAGQHPVLLKRPIKGYVGNRLQAAVVNEAMHLVAEGVMNPRDIDSTLSIGLARRWAFMGPFETMDLNADGGVGEYMSKYGPVYNAIGADLQVASPWTPDAIDEVARDRRSSAPLDSLAEQRAIRDRRLARLNAFLRTCESAAAGEGPAE